VTVLLRRLSVVFALVVGIATVGMSAAWAHVTVSASSARQGGYGQITFTMPNESAAATCTKLVIQVPSDTPIATVRTLPVPGWTATITTHTLPQPVTIQGRQVIEAVDTITWTATGAGLSPSEYQTFSFSGGPLPMSPTIVFKALQFYSDGTQTDWVETAAPGSDEPDHPAPTLTLSPASDPSGSTADGSGSANDGSQAHASGDSGSQGLSIAALAVGVVAALLAGAALMRSRPSRNGPARNG